MPPTLNNDMASAIASSSPQPSTSKPHLDVHYTAPGFCPPHPDTVDQLCEDRSNLIFCHGVVIVKISPEVAVKFGPHINIIEAKNMIYVAQNTGVPVPKVFAYYTYGPIDRDPDDFGGLYDTYIFMSYVAGETLYEAWNSLSVSTKSHISRQLASCVQEIRDIEPTRYIGSIDRGPVTDCCLATSIDKGIALGISDHYTRTNHLFQGPFNSEQEFNTAIINNYLNNAPKRHIKSFLSRMLPVSHRILFAHGDLRPRNIIVKDGKVAAIIDWERSGWYPEYWEYAKALLVWHWQSDWTDYLVQILQPYHAEYFMHSFLIEKLLI
ncbi:hypothetical protein N7489_001524 [Penicillium chrysogenum]|uniref:uncharacterized protein n=1 Tax=Penicillium chrysogenum TaxID=5076 RepID=UPI0024DF2D2D|nr:uncharacterized protein N7489_001524 [Penicillium chrysogenum]KAJ5251114.1 hypothetical protein N7489_001524 [Penicillium chrysogenum]